MMDDACERQKSLPREFQMIHKRLQYFRKMSRGWIQDILGKKVERPKSEMRKLLWQRSGSIVGILILLS